MSSNGVAIVTALQSVPFPKHAQATIEWYKLPIHTPLLYGVNPLSSIFVTEYPIQPVATHNIRLSGNAIKVGTGNCLWYLFDRACGTMSFLSGLHFVYTSSISPQLQVSFLHTKSCFRISRGRLASLFTFYHPSTWTVTVTLQSVTTEPGGTAPLSQLSSLLSSILPILFSLSFAASPDQGSSPA